MIFHVLNRGVGRRTLFHKEADYAAFERILCEALARVPTMRLLACCVMPNHWHQVLWPRADGDLTGYLRWLTHTHTQRYHAHYHTAGTGHLYQGRFKSFPIEADEHLLTVCRYVERNALRANLCARAEDWRWGSTWWRTHDSTDAMPPRLSDGPVPRPADWVERVNAPQSAQELEALRRSVQRSCPFGSERWQAQTARELRIEWTLRPPGRPRKIVEAMREHQPVL